MLESHRNAHFCGVDQTVFGIFKHLTLVSRSEGNFVADTILAALAIRYDCRFVSADRGFQRYPGLEVEVLT